MYVCIYIWMYLYIRISFLRALPSFSDLNGLNIQDNTYVMKGHINGYICIYICACMCVCMYVCTYGCIYIYVCHF
jgi:hypothetical protein